MNNNMIALMASIGAQLDVPKLAEPKAKIVKTVSAAVLAASIGMAGGIAHAQEQQPAQDNGHPVAGAAIGGVTGWGIAKIFGASPATRNVIGALGAVVGGVVGSHTEVVNPQAAKPGQGVSQALAALSPDQASRMTRMQLDALSKRLAYQSAFKDAQLAKLDRDLNAGNPEFDAKMKRAASTMMQAYRQDQEATNSFVTAFESAKGARVDVSSYAATYAKLKQKFDVNDQSYGKLAEQVQKNASIDAGVNADSKTEKKAEGGLSI